MSQIVHARIEWDTPDGDFLKAKNLEKGGLVQTAIDNAVIRYGIPYCPFVTGTLAKSPFSSSPPGSGQVIYNTPYARYLYYGIVYGPNIPVFDDDSGEPAMIFSPPGKKKSPTVPEQNLVFNQSYSPLAGSFWFERLKADHLQAIGEEARMVANR